MKKPFSTNLSKMGRNKKSIHQLLIITIGLLAVNVFPQQSFQYEINKDVSKEVIEHGNVYSFDAYEVTQKDIEYHEYVEGEVPTAEYKIQLNEMETYQHSYDDYSKKVESHKQRETAINKIIEKAEMYLNSSGDRSEREKYLKEGQELADKNNITIETNKEEKKSFFEKVSSTGTSNSSYKRKREIALYEKGERIKEREVEIYLDGIKELKTKTQEPKKRWDVVKYLELKEELETIPKTEKGMVLSDEVSVRNSYMVTGEPIDVYSINGVFEVISDDFMLAKRDIDNKFVKNELTTDMKDYNNVGGLSKRYPLVKETTSGKLYYLMSDTFLSALSHGVKQKKLLERVHQLGYEPFEIGEYYYIKTKTCRLKLDNWTYDGLMNDNSYISTIDKDHSRINALAKQTTQHSKKLDKYLSIYNIKRSLTPTSTLNAWRDATKSAMEFDKPLYKLLEKYSGNYSIIPLNENTSKLLNEFSDNILASRGVLGI